MQVDWPRLLGDLQYLLGEPHPANPDVRTSVGTPTLANHLGISRGAVRNLLDGSEPRFRDGQHLIEAWCRLSGKSSAYLPMAAKGKESKKNFGRLAEKSQ